MMTAGTDGPFAVCFAGGMRNFAAVWPSWKVSKKGWHGGGRGLSLARSVAVK